MANNISSLSLGSSILSSGSGKPNSLDDGTLFYDGFGDNFYFRNQNVTGGWENIFNRNRAGIYLINNTTTTTTATNSWVGIFGLASINTNSSSNFILNNQSITILSATGDGGFENTITTGTQGFADNGWTVSNGSQGNKWFVGSTGASGSGFGAYISNNNGASNLYTVGSASSVWFYRDIDLPPYCSTINVSLAVRTAGETTYDILRLFNFNTSEVLIAGSPSPGGTTWVVPASYTAAQLAEYTVLTGFSQYTLNFSAPTISSSTQSRRFAFAWRNDGSLGTNPPASVDKISITTQVPIKLNYTGSQSKFKAVLSGSFQSTSSLSNVGVQISKNRVTSGNGPDTSFNISANFKDSFIVQDTFTLSNGDYIEPLLNNRVSNASVLVNDLQLYLWEIPD